MDLVKQKFNRLEVIKFSHNDKYSRRIWKCKCECGNIVLASTNSLRRNNTKSCGCLQKEMTSVQGKKIVGVWIGENHPNWKGGITSQRQLFNASKEAKEWRVNVFERDKYTCQKCGQVGGELNSHHIIPFAVDRLLSLSLDNGITLCKDCHIKIHKLEGKPKEKRFN